MLFVSDPFSPIAVTPIFRFVEPLGHSVLCDSIGPHEFSLKLRCFRKPKRERGKIRLGFASQTIRITKTLCDLPMAQLQSECFTVDRLLRNVSQLLLTTIAIPETLCLVSLDNEVPLR